MSDQAGVADSAGLAGAEDVADARAAARDDLLRARGGRGVRAARHHGPDGVFRVGAPLPMGAVTADVVVSTFFNFDPELVHAAIPAAWAVATPAQLVAARFAAVDAALRRLLGEMVLASEEMRRAAVLARAAAEAACRAGTEGRPLAAAHADVGWPIEPHLQLCTCSRSCVSSGATVTSHSSWCTGSRAPKRWSPTRRPATYRPTSCAPRGDGPPRRGGRQWTHCGGEAGSI